jgi:hypothetical protein
MQRTALRAAADAERWAARYAKGVCSPYDRDKIMNHGEYTARAARLLIQRLPAEQYDILFDHGQTGIDSSEQLGRITVWYGSAYTSQARLAFLDIAVLERETDRVRVLIEIEESTSKPKVIIGDAVAVLLGEQITFQSTRHLKVGPWTTLLVLVQSAALSSTTRLTYLQNQLNLLKGCLQTRNALLDQILIAGYQNEEELDSQLWHHVATILNAPI